MFVLSTALSAFTTIEIGVENLATLSVGDYFKYQLLPSFILAVVMYAFMAKRNVVNAYRYAMSVFLCIFILGCLIISLITQAFYFHSVGLMELLLSLISAIVGTLIGVFWSRKSAEIN